VRGRRVRGVGRICEGVGGMCRDRGCGVGGEGEGAFRGWGCGVVDCGCGGGGGGGVGLGGLHGEKLCLLLADHEEEAVLLGRGNDGLVGIFGDQDLRG